MARRFGLPTILALVMAFVGMRAPFDSAALAQGKRLESATGG